jgi:hypothetical protein
MNVNPLKAIVHGTLSGGELSDEELLGGLLLQGKPLKLGKDMKRTGGSKACKKTGGAKCKCKSNNPWLIYLAAFRKSHPHLKGIEATKAAKSGYAAWKAENGGKIKVSRKSGSKKTPKRKAASKKSPKRKAPIKNKWNKYEHMEGNHNFTKKQLKMIYDLVKSNKKRKGGMGTSALLKQLKNL